VTEEVYRRLAEWGGMGIFEVVLRPTRTWLYGPSTGLRHEPVDWGPGAAGIEALIRAARAEAAEAALRTPQVADGRFRWRATETGHRTVVLRRIEHAPRLDDYGGVGAAIRAYAREEADEDRAGVYCVLGRPASGKSALLGALMADALAAGRAAFYTDEVLEFDLTRLPDGAPVFVRPGRAADLWSDGEATPEVLRLAGVRDLFVGEVRSAADVRSVLGLAGLGYRVWTTAHAAAPEVGVRRLRALVPEGSPDLLRAVVYTELYPDVERRNVVPVAGLYVLEELPVEALDFDEAIRQAAARSWAWRRSLAEAVESGRIDPASVPASRRRLAEVRPVAAYWQS